MFSAISQGSPAEGIVSNLGIGSTFSAGDVQTYTMVKTLMAQTAGMKMTGYSIDSATTSTGALNSIRLEAPNKTTYIVWLRIGDSAYAINNLPSTATVTGPTGTNLTSGIVSGSYSVTPPTLTSPQGPIYISY
jgi:hypothetical protein